MSNSFASVLHVVNAEDDTYAGHTINSGSLSGLMAVTPSRALTLVVRGTPESTASTIAVVDNASESLLSSVPLPGWTEMLAISPDSKTLWAPLRNTTVNAGSPAGALAVISLENFTGTTTAIPAARRAFLSHSGAKLIVLPDTVADPAISNSVFIFDTASRAVTQVSGFDHPAWAVFSSDDATAYIMNCGPECGGSTAGVQPLTVASGTAGSAVPVPGGATVGLLQNNNLYVAGTATGSGELAVLNVSSWPATFIQSAVAIGDGYHDRIAMGAGNKLFVGGRTCTTVGKQCLAIYDAGSNPSSAVVGTINLGPVTGIEPIAGRNVVYVIEGGELVIYDTTTNAALPQERQIDLVGQAVDVKLIDP